MTSSSAQFARGTFDVGWCPAAFWVAGLTLASALGGLHRSDPVLAMWVGVTALTAWWLSAIDIREHRLPNRIVGPLAALATTIVVVLGVDGQAERAVTAAIFAGAISGALFLLHFVASLGMGDAKCAWPFYLLVGWFGATTVQLSVLVTLVAAGGTAGLLVLRHRNGRLAIPFGPFLTAGLFVGIAAASLG